MDINTEKQLSKFLSDKGASAAFKVTEYNSAETYIKVSWYSKTKTILSSKDIYFGVHLDNIDSIDKNIDDSKTIVIKY